MRKTLTLEDLKRAMTTYAVPEWVTEIRDASEVTVRPSQWIKPGESYVIADDLRVLVFGADHQPSAHRMVVCHYDDEDRVREIVEEIRAPTTRGEADG